MIKLTKLIKENEEPKGFSTDTKKNFLEIVSTYNKYQEMMDRKSDITKIAETLGAITDAASQLAMNEGDDWFDKHTVKRNMGDLTKMRGQFDKLAKESAQMDQRMSGLYEDMGHILSRYYKIGEITEDEMKNRLGMTNESKQFISEGTLKDDMINAIKEKGIDSSKIKIKYFKQSPYQKRRFKPEHVEEEVWIYTPKEKNGYVIVRSDFNVKSYRDSFLDMISGENGLRKESVNEGMKKWKVDFKHTDGSKRTVDIEAFNKERAEGRFEVNWGKDMKILKVYPATKNESVNK